MTEPIWRKSRRSASPESPPELDQRILQYARENVPEQENTAKHNWWASGFAAACIASVAVIIAVPDQPDQVRQSNHPAETAAAGVEEAAFAAQKSRARLSADDKPAAEQLTAPVSVQTLGGESDATLSATLQRLQAQWLAGEEQAAQEAWEAYREQCPECKLPMDLQEALETHLP